MEQTLSILLVEDEPSEIAEFRAGFDGQKDFHLVECTSSAKDAIRLCNEFDPDVVILDLELSKGSGSGLDVLKAISSADITRKPFIVVTTNNASPIIHNQARALSADYIIAKYQDAYSVDYVIDFIRDCKQTIIATQKKQTQKSSISIETKEQQSTRIQRQLFVEFNQIGIVTKLKGRSYLAAAVELYLRNPQQNLREIIAKENGKTPMSVERAMQSAIVSAWNSTHPDDLQRYYTAPIRPDRGVPTVLEFVSYYAQKILKDG